LSLQLRKQNAEKRLEIDLILHHITATPDTDFHKKYQLSFS